MKIASQSNVNHMMLRYFQNANAMNAQSIKRIASGYKVNSAADDASGLAIARKMAAQLSGGSAAGQNIQDAVSMIQTADGALGQVGDMTGRMQELAMRAGNGILGDDDRALLQQEFDQLAGEIDRIGKETTFNGKQLFDGSTYRMQVGGSAGSGFDVKMGEVSSSALGLDKVDLSSASGIGGALNAIKKAGTNISAQRAVLGGAENGLTSTYNNLTNYETNLSDSLSKIMDTDIGRQSISRGISDLLHQTGGAMMRNAQYLMPYNAVQMLLK